MPRFPEFQPKQGIISDNPVGYSPRAATDATEMLGKVGGVAASVALEIAEKRKQAEDQDFSHSSSQETLRRIEAKSEELKLTMSPDAKGFSEAIKNYSKELTDEYEQKAPSETAKRYYRTLAEPIATRAYVTANGEEFKQRAQYFKTNITNDDRKNADTLLRIPNMDNAITMGMSQSVRLSQGVGTSVNEFDANQQIKVSKAQHADAYFAGLAAQALASESPKTAKAIYLRGIQELKGEDLTSKSRRDRKEEALTDWLPPEKLEHYLDEYARGLKSRKESDMKDLTRRFSNAVAAASAGKDLDWGVVNKIMAKKASGEITPSEATDKLSALNYAAAGGQVRTHISSTPRDQLPALLDGADSRVERTVQNMVRGLGLSPDEAKEYFSEDNRQQQRHLTEATIRHDIEQRDKDPAAHVTQHARHVQNLYAQANPIDPLGGVSRKQQTDQYAHTLEVEFDRLQQPEHLRKYLKKEHSQFLARTLGAEGTDERTAAQVVSGLQAQWGDDRFQKVMKQIVDDGKLDESWRLVSVIPSQFGRQEVVAAIKNKKKIYESLQKARPDMKFDEFKKDVASNDTMRGVFAAISSSSQGGARENVNAALAEFVALKAAQKASDPSISTSEAIDATVKNVIGDSFYVVQQDRSQVLLPKAVGDTPISDKRIVAAFKGYLKPSALDRLEVRLPAGKDFGLSTPDVQKSDFYDLVDNTGKWVMDEFGGARLMVWNRFRGQYEYVLNKNNSPIRIDYLQEMKNPSKETIEAEKSIWQKLKEML